MTQSFPEELVYPALPRRSRGGPTHTWWHVGQPCGKASWESHVGKPRGKATDPFIQAKGSPTLLLEREERAPAFPHSSTFAWKIPWMEEPGGPESPRCLRPFQGTLFSLHCLDFQAEDRLTPRWHVVQPVGKPRGKATDPLIHAKGSVTLLLQLGRKAHVHAPTRDEG